MANEREFSSELEKYTNKDYNIREMQDVLYYPTIPVNICFVLPSLVY